MHSSSRLRRSVQCWSNQLSDVFAAISLPVEEAGDRLLGLLDDLRANVAATLEAAAQKDALAAKVCSCH